MERFPNASLEFTYTTALNEVSFAMLKQDRQLHYVDLEIFSTCRLIREGTRLLNISVTCSYTEIDRSGPETDRSTLVFVHREFAESDRRSRYILRLRGEYLRVGYAGCHFG